MHDSEICIGDDFSRKLISYSLNFLKNQLACFFPLYINKATLIKDPLERFKLVIAASLSSFYLTNSFAKPVIKTI